MSHSTRPDCEPNSSSTLPEEPGVLVVLDPLTNSLTRLIGPKSDPDLERSAAL